MDRRLAKIEQHLLQPKESLYNILRYICIATIGYVVVN